MGAPVIVLVTFYSRCGATEALALSAAVGAVQARANIRLRRLPDVSAGQTLVDVADCRETLARMHKEYVAPAEADILAADAIVIAPPAGFDAAAPEWAGYLALLSRLAAAGTLARKVAAVVDAGDAATRDSFSDALLQAGLVIVPADPPTAGTTPVLGTEGAGAHGRRVAAVARALKLAG